MTTDWEAPEGEIWVCVACGKTSKNRIDGISKGWDESCFLNSILVKEDMCIFSKKDKTRVVKTCWTIKLSPDVLCTENPISLGDLLLQVQRLINKHGNQTLIREECEREGERIGYILCSNDCQTGGKNKEKPRCCKKDTGVDKAK